MTLAQIGEFSFVIAGIGITTGAVSGPLYPVAVMVSVITCCSRPTMMRLADPISATIDRRLPKPVQTFVTLYDSWIELARRGTGRKPVWEAIRRPLRWMFLDAVVIAAVIIGAAQARPRLRDLLSMLGNRAGWTWRSWPPGGARAPLRDRARGVGPPGRDPARRSRHAPARAGSGPGAFTPRRPDRRASRSPSSWSWACPLIAVTQPFLSAWPVAIVVGALLLLLAVGFWRSASNLQGHVRAGAELIVDVIARQGVDKDEHSLEVVQEMLPGLGTIVPFHVEPTCAGIGLSLGDLNLRGLTGVTVVALIRGTHRLVFPKADEVHPGRRRAGAHRQQRVDRRRAPDADGDRARRGRGR